MKKEDFLQRIRQAKPAAIPMPLLDDLQPTTYIHPIEQFAKATEMAGGQVVEARPTDDLSALLRSLHPKAQQWVSALPWLQVGQHHPDQLTPDQLSHTDVAVVQGALGVAENGCVWVPQTTEQRAHFFIAEALVLVLDRHHVVQNMHEAYERIHTDPRYEFGTFISGPSKTADIEQALVVGAQAARSLTVLLI